MMIADPTPHERELLALLDVVLSGGCRQDGAELQHSDECWPGSNGSLYCHEGKFNIGFSGRSYAVVAATRDSYLKGLAGAPWVSENERADGWYELGAELGDLIEWQP